MASYNYIEQGGYKLLTYKISEEDQMDSLAVGQLADSSSIISGVLPIAQSEVDGVTEFQVNVTGMITLEEFFRNPVSPKSLLKIYKQIASALKEADDYMMEYNVFVLDKKYVYISARDEKVYLVALPVIHETMSPESFLKNLLFQDFDETEDSKLVVELNRVFHLMESFSIGEFLEKLEQIPVSNQRYPRRGVNSSSENHFGGDERVEPVSQDVSGSGMEYKRKSGQELHEQGDFHGERKPSSNGDISDEGSFQENSEEKPSKKSFLDALFKKKNKKLKKKNERVSEPLDNGFAIPGQDNKSAERKRDAADIESLESAGGIRQQRVEGKLVYQNPPQNFGTTIVETDDFSWDRDSLDKTIVEEDASEYPQVLLTLLDNKGHPVRKTIEITLRNGCATVGRYDKTGQRCADFNFDCSLTFISREHLQFSVRNGQIEVIDKNSVNGTLLNGERIIPEIGYPICQGDVIELSAKTRLAYRVEKISCV